MSFEQALNTIIELNEEIRAVKFLMGVIESNTEDIEADNAEMSSCLRAIKKINGNKNEAINALCKRNGG